MLPKGMIGKWSPVTDTLLRGFPKANRISDLGEQGFGLIVGKFHMVCEFLFMPYVNGM